MLECERQAWNEEMAGVPTAVLPTEAAWRERAPPWARPLWPELASELARWCRDHQVRLDIDPRAGVY